MKKKKNWLRINYWVNLLTTETKIFDKYLKISEIIPWGSWNDIKHESINQYKKREKIRRLWNIIFRLY